MVNFNKPEDENPRKIYWNSFLMAVNPDSIVRYESEIIEAECINHCLIMQVKRIKDGLENTIAFTYTGNALDEREYFIGELADLSKKVVREVYDSFKVSKAEDLKGKKVIGLYHSELEKLLGIEKK